MSAIPVATRPEASTITGTLTRILFRDEESGMAILHVQPEEGGDSVSVRGATLAKEGDVIAVAGVWKEHPRYGRQVVADSIIALRPKTVEAIAAHIGSGILPGIGKAMAERIVGQFGTETLDMLDAHPEKLCLVRGIGPGKIDGIKEAWNEQKASQEIMLFLASQGISQSIAIRIFKRYQDKAIAIIRENPYRLARDIRGIGFSTADEIAQSLGVPPNSIQRMEAGIRHVVFEATRRGHCGLGVVDALGKSAQLLDLRYSQISDVLEQILQEPHCDIVRITLPDDVPVLCPNDLYQAEIAIARGLLGLARKPAAWLMDARRREQIVKDAEDVCQTTLAVAQRQAVSMVLMHRLSVLTGGPGTGKTSTLKVILHALSSLRLRVVLAAPTGKAAKRMHETTGHEASTVARLVGMGTGMPTPIECDILVIDEASMVDVLLLQDVLEKLVHGASLLLVGDVDQLASVGAGRVLADVIESKSVKVTRLTEVFRQAAESAIVRNAHRVNAGERLEGTVFKRSDLPSDCYFFSCSKPDAIVDRVAELMATRIPERFAIPPSDIQVLTPMRRTPTGSENLNQVLQASINPTPVDFLERGGVRYGVGDRIVQTVNNYDLRVMNGESGIIRAIHRIERQVIIDFDGRLVIYPLGDMDQVVLAYAMSVHKSQGSQFSAVILVMTHQHRVMLVRSILYTGMTRAIRLCVIVGQESAVNAAIRNDRAEPRITTLKHRLMGAL